MSKQLLFDQSDDEDIMNERVKSNLDKALKKTQFTGKSGKMLMELQKSYKDEQRFVLDKKFKNDIEVQRIPQKLKEVTHAFDKKDIEESYAKERVNPNDDINSAQEKNKNLSILSSIIPNSEFLSTSKRVFNPRNLIQKRFDPTLNLGKELLIVEDKKVAVVDTKYTTMKLEKGVGLNNVYNKSYEGIVDKNEKNFKKMKRKEKDYVMSKVVNEVNDELEHKIEINYDSWKNISKKKKEAKSAVASVTANASTFLLFGDTEPSLVKIHEKEKINKESSKRKNETKNQEKTIKNTIQNEPEEKPKDDKQNEFLEKKKERNDKKKLKHKAKKEGIKLKGIYFI